MRKRSILLLAIVSTTFFMASNIFAAENDYTEIRSVKFTLSSDSFDEYGYPELTGSTSATNYSIGDVYRYTTSQDPDWGDDYEEEEDDHDNWWEEDYDPYDFELEQEKLRDEYEQQMDELEIPLNYYMYDAENHPLTSEVYVAEFTCDGDSYKFKDVKTDRVTIRNVDARIHSAYIENNGATLKVKFTLNNEHAFVGKIADDSVRLSDDYVLSWDIPEFATRYRLKVYGGGIGSEEIYTDAQSFNLKGLATKAGQYRISLAAIGANTSKVKEFSELKFNVSEEQAAQNAAELGDIPLNAWYKEDRETTVTNENGESIKVPVEIWHYRLNNGIIAQGQWVSYVSTDANGIQTTAWYYLYPNTDMATSAWIETNGKFYYVDENGVMLVNTTTPDNKIVNEKGERVDDK